MDSTMIGPHFQLLTRLDIRMSNSEKREDQEDAEHIDHRDAPFSLRKSVTDP